MNMTTKSGTQLVPRLGVGVPPERRFQRQRLLQQRGAALHGRSGIRTSTAQRSPDRSRGTKRSSCLPGRDSQLLPATSRPPMCPPGHAERHHSRGLQFVRRSCRIMLSTLWEIAPLRIRQELPPRQGHGPSPTSTRETAATPRTSSSRPITRLQTPPAGIQLVPHHSARRTTRTSTTDVSITTSATSNGSLAAIPIGPCRIPGTRNSSKPTAGRPTMATSSPIPIRLCWETPIPSIPPPCWMFISTM